MPRTVLALGLIMLLSGSTSAGAQEAPLPGSRVRLTAPDCGLASSEATFRAVRADTLFFSGGECPLPSVAGLQVHHQGNRSGRGALVGAIVGGAAAGLSHSAYCGVCKPGAGGLLAALGAVPGALAGALVGSFFTTESWVDVPVDRLRVQVDPAAASGAITLGFSVRGP